MPVRTPRAYEGPECPHCGARLTRSWMHSGVINCPDCSHTFEAVAFEAPAPKLRVVEVGAAATTADGVTACANHARNAAVTNCQRCGLFICALCEVNLGGGSFCPNCFDRTRGEESPGGSRTRYRDYVSMARVGVLVGIPLMAFGVLFGAVSAWYARKGAAQRASEGRSTIGAWILFAFAILETIGGAMFVAFLLYALLRTQPR